MPKEEIPKREGWRNRGEPLCPPHPRPRPRVSGAPGLVGVCLRGREGFKLPLSDGASLPQRRRGRGRGRERGAGAGAGAVSAGPGRAGRVARRGRQGARSAQRRGRARPGGRSPPPPPPVAPVAPVAGETEGPPAARPRAASAEPR